MCYGQIFFLATCWKRSLIFKIGKDGEELNLNPMSQLKQRLAMSTLVVGIVVISVLLSFDPTWGFLCPALVVTIAAVAVWEYYQLAKTQGATPLQKLGIGCSIAYLIAIFFQQQGTVSTTFPMVLLALSFLSFFLLFCFRGDRPIINLAVSVFGIAYITIPLSCWIRITYFFPDHSVVDGRLWLAYLIIVTKITDTGAYFVGKCMGKRRLASHLSPNKTIEGALGGMVCAIAASLCFGPISHFVFPQLPFELATFVALMMGISIGIVAQVGDLMESLLKRDAEIKDSNRLPGFGGVLDMIDSLIFTSPLVYFVMKTQYPLEVL